MLLTWLVWALEELLFLLHTADLVTNAEGQTRSSHKPDSPLLLNVSGLTQTSERCKSIFLLSNNEVNLQPFKITLVVIAVIWCAFRNWAGWARGPWRPRRPRGSRQITCRWLAGKVRFCTTGKRKLETWALTTWKVSFQKNFLFFTLFHWKEKKKKSKSKALSATFNYKSLFGKRLNTLCITQLSESS